MQRISVLTLRPFIMSNTRVGKRTKNIPIELQRRSSRNVCNQKPTKVPIESEIRVKVESSTFNDTKPTIIQTDCKPEPILRGANTKGSISLPQPDGFLNVSELELDLERTLLGGQSFRWTKSFGHDEGGEHVVFTGVIQDTALKIWRVSDQQIAITRLTKSRFGEARDFERTQEMLEDYFQLKYNLRDLYNLWSTNDKYLSQCCFDYPGFRILRQDPVENFFSFICATNNNIKRITQMVDSLCKRFGTILEYRDDEDAGDVYSAHRQFPKVESLAKEDVFEILRHHLGFGYRAQYIFSSASRLISEATAKNCSPRDILLSYRKANMSYEETRKNLMSYHGIGRKVADCICLMSMDHLDSVPVDCHIYQIVARQYLPELDKNRKTLNTTIHDSIRDYFRKLHGPLAGWSSSVLFVAELKHLKQQEDACNESPTKNNKKGAKAKAKSTAKTKKIKVE